MTEPLCACLRLKGNTVHNQTSEIMEFWTKGTVYLLFVMLKPEPGLFFSRFTWYHLLAFNMRNSLGVSLTINDYRIILEYTRSNRRKTVLRRRWDFQLDWFIELYLYLNQAPLCSFKNLRWLYGLYMVFDTKIRKMSHYFPNSP